MSSNFQRSGFPVPPQSTLFSRFPDHVQIEKRGSFPHYLFVVSMLLKIEHVANVDGWTWSFGSKHGFNHHPFLRGGRRINLLAMSPILDSCREFGFDEGKHQQLAGSIDSMFLKGWLGLGHQCLPGSRKRHNSPHFVTSPPTKTSPEYGNSCMVSNPADQLNPIEEIDSIPRLKSVFF